MESYSITQLTSLSAVIGAAVFLTYLAKKYLADVPVLSKLPVWVYTSTFAGVLAYYANQVVGSLPGQTGIVVVDAIILGFMSSGARKQVQTIATPLEDSSTARESSLRPNPRRFVGVVLLAAVMSASSCAGFLPAPVTPNPTQEQTDATRAQALKIAQAAEAGGELLVRIVRAAISAREAGLVPKSQTDVLMRAVDRMEPHSVNDVHVGLCAWTLLDTIEKATTEPELRRTVGALLDLVVPILEAAAATKDSAVADLANRLRDAYALASAFLGRDDELWAVDLGGVR